MYAQSQQKNLQNQNHLQVLKQEGLRSLFKRIQRAQTKLSGEVDAPTSRQKLLSKTWNLFCLVHTCAPTEDFLGADNISVYTIHEYFECAPSPPPLGTSTNRSSDLRRKNPKLRSPQYLMYAQSQQKNLQISNKTTCRFENLQEGLRSLFKQIKRGKRSCPG